ncbi:MAG: transporter substrate-binding domain-containing protein [Eggerthellaceae bacterium]|nr:transporter substrate-binding domain-containing protein [Eggerthellaceae bacterium]MCH4220407.1 transporter substrate-binding domain-containing protein [Eggerthellaceae bacterium]
MKRSTVLLVAGVLAMSLLLCLGGCSSNTLLSSTPYSPEMKSAQVAPPTIGENGVLRVGVNSNNAPFASQASGKVVGLDVDTAAAIADELGLKLEIVDVGSDPEGALEDGTIDIAMNIEKSDTNSRSFALTDPYVQTAVALFAQSGTSAPSSSSLLTQSIEAQSSSLSAWQVTNQYGDSALKTTSDLKGAFADLSSGSTKYVAADAVIGTYVAKVSSCDASIVALLQKSTGYCIGVSSSNTDLKNAVSNALSTIQSNGVMNVIQTQWLGAPLDISSVPVVTTSKSTSSTTSSSNSSTKNSSTSNTSNTSSSSSSSNSSSGTSSGTAGSNAVQIG